MRERTYKIRIYGPSRIINIRGKQVRSPLQAVVSSSELQVIKTSLASCGHKDFIVEEISKPYLTEFQEVVNKESLLMPLEKKVVLSYDEVKAKLLSKVAIRPKFTRQRGPKDSPLRDKIKPEVLSPSFFVPIQKVDFEIRIEDLKIESDSILKKLVKESEK